MTARKPATLNRVCGDAPILIDCVEQRFALTLGVRVEIEGVLGLARRGELGARRGRLGAPVPARRLIITHMEVLSAATASARPTPGPGEHDPSRHYKGLGCFDRISGDPVRGTPPMAQPVVSHLRAANGKALALQGFSLFAAQVSGAGIDLR